MGDYPQKKPLKYFNGTIEALNGNAIRVSGLDLTLKTQRGQTEAAALGIGANVRYGMEDGGNMSEICWIAAQKQQGQGNSQGFGNGNNYRQTQVNNSPQQAPAAPFNLSNCHCETLKPDVSTSRVNAYIGCMRVGGIVVNGTESDAQAKADAITAIADKLFDKVVAKFPHLAEAKAGA